MNPKVPESLKLEHEELHAELAPNMQRILPSECHGRYAELRCSYQPNIPLSFDR